MDTLAWLVIITAYLVSLAGTGLLCATIERTTDSKVAATSSACRH